jgi:hypothetical protein
MAPDRFALAVSSNSPSDGEAGGKPNPRKSRAVSVVTEPGEGKGMKVTVEIQARLAERCY